MSLWGHASDWQTVTIKLKLHYSQIIMQEKPKQESAGCLYPEDCGHMSQTEHHPSLPKPNQMFNLTIAVFHLLSYCILDWITSTYLDPCV